MSSPIQNTLDRLQRETSNFVAAAVVNAEDGISLTQRCVDDSFDAETAASYFVEVVRNNDSALKALRLVDQTQEMMIVADQTIILLHAIADTPFYLVMALEQGANLGMAKLIIRNAEPELRKALMF